MSDAFLVIRERGLAITIAGTDGCEFLLSWITCPPIRSSSKSGTARFSEPTWTKLGFAPPAFVVMAGINTHACVRTTAIDAYQRDYHVVIASDCVASYDDEYHHVSMRYLGGRTRIMSNGELSRLVDNSDA